MLLTLTARAKDCTLTIVEHGAKMSNNLVGVDGLVLHCDHHGELASYTMIQYPKYSAAKHAAFDAGAQHVGLDRLIWT